MPNDLGSRRSTFESLAFVGRVARAMAGPVACAVVAGWPAVWLWSRPVTATGSATSTRYTVGYVAEGLLDGSSRSVWLPGTTPAHVDIDFPSARHFESISLTNADNFPQQDVSTRTFRVDLLDHGTLQLSREGTFATPTELVRIATGSVRADRIRVTLLSSRGRSGCLGDVRWEAW